MREGGTKMYPISPSSQLVSTFLPVASASFPQCPNSSGQRKTAVSLLPSLPQPQRRMYVCITTGATDFAVMLTSVFTMST